MKADNEFPSLDVGLSRRLFVPILCPYDQRQEGGSWKKGEKERVLMGQAVASFGPYPSLYLATQFYSRLVCYNRLYNSQL